MGKILIDELLLDEFGARLQEIGSMNNDEDSAIAEKYHITNNAMVDGVRHGVVATNVASTLRDIERVKAEAKERAAASYEIAPEEIESKPTKVYNRGHYAGFVDDLADEQ